MLEPPSRQPPVPIRLQFDPGLASRLEASEPLRMAVGQAVERGLAETMACLGIPGQPSVAIERLNGDGVEMQIVQPARRLSSFAVPSRIGGATQDEGGKPISEGVVNRGMAIE
jgi:hypothetical protein